MSNWTGDQLVEIDCNFCGSRNDDLIIERRDGLRVVQCVDCGLVYLNPRPKDELIPALYDSEYFSSKTSVGFDNYFSEETRRGLLNASKSRLLVLNENGVYVDGRVLEVGCATGEFCHILKNLGFDVRGVDISEPAISEARARYDSIPFCVGSIDDMDSENKYNAIFAFEVIEHLTDPDRFFDKISKLLEVTGFLCVTTPSIECARYVGFQNWKGFSQSFEHLYFFSQETIAKYAARHGLHSEITLHGGGMGLTIKNIDVRQNLAKKTIKRILSSMHLLPILITFLDKMRPVKHTYQSQHIQHNLLMILRKGKQLN